MVQRWQSSFYVVMLVLQILIAPAWACSCGGVSIKADMHTFQIMLETYYQRHHRYPSNLDILEVDAIAKSYSKSLSHERHWVEMSNSNDFKQQMILKYQECSASILGVRIYFTQNCIDPTKDQLVLYKLLSPQQYAIYGTDRNGQLVQDKGIAFYLTNS